MALYGLFVLICHKETTHSLSDCMIECFLRKIETANLTSRWISTGNYLVYIDAGKTRTQPQPSLHRYSIDTRGRQIVTFIGHAFNVMLTFL